MGISLVLQKEFFDLMMELDDRSGDPNFNNSSSEDHECLLPNFTDIHPIVFEIRVIIWEP